jgi:hypothetical protein
MKFSKYLAASAVALAAMALSANTAYAACASDNLPSGMDKPGGYPQRALTMVVPYGPAGGSGQVAQAMAQAVSDLTGVSINRDHKPGHRRHDRFHGQSGRRLQRPRAHRRRLQRTRAGFDPA